MVAVRRDGAVNLSLRYIDGSPRHIGDSAAVIGEICRLVSSINRVEDSAEALHVRVGHVDHGGSLNLNLFVFPIVPFSGQQSDMLEVEGPPQVHEGEPSKLRAAKMISTGHLTDEKPLTLAVVVNIPIEVQIISTLVTLADLIQRSVAVSERSVDVFSSTTFTAEGGRAVETEIRESVRKYGWRLVSQQLKVRAERAGFPLHVTYAAPLMPGYQIAERAPVMRYVYNSVEEARVVVDKMVAVMSTGMRITGTGPDLMLRRTNDMLDVTSFRKFMAHTNRDAIVCGNGVIIFGEMPDADIRLVEPEVLVNPPSKSDSLLHIRGMDQIDSAFGISELEPLVNIVLTRDTMVRVGRNMQAWLRAGTLPPEERDIAERHIAAAEQTLETAGKEAERIMGYATLSFQQPPEDLYFSGLRTMGPAPQRLVIDGR